MRLSRRAAVLMAAVLSVHGTATGQNFPTTPPAPMPLGEAQFPRFVEFELANGLRVLVVPSEKQPVLSLTLAVHGGGVHDANGKVGTADLVAALLTKGAGTRTAEQIAEAIERVGGSLSASAGADFLSMTATVLQNDRELAFSLLADAMLRPTFPESEIALARQQTLSGLELERSQPEAIASRHFLRVLYGDHPYGRRPTEASVRAITREDLVSFHRSRVRPHQGLLVLAGAIDSVEAHRLVSRHFDQWTGEMRAMPPMRPAPQRQRTEILLVHRPGSVQANILVGNTTWQPTDTRSYALALGNQVLGGAADSRLFTILREEKGWTYGSYSGATRYRGLGYWDAGAETRTEVADSALVEMLAQIRRMSSELVPVDEFERQKQSIIGRFPLQVETAAQVAAQVGNARLLNLAIDYVQTYRQRLAAVTREQVQAAARGGMRADAALVVVVGDGTLLRDKLAAIAPVTMVDIDGNVIAAEDIATTAAGAGAPLALDLTRLAARSDSFDVQLQGRSFGFQTVEMVRLATGWEFRERSALGPIISQETIVQMTDSLQMIANTQTGRFQGAEFGLTVRYRDGFAWGEGLTPSNTGALQTVKYDSVAYAPGVMDDNIVNSMLGLLPWAPDARFTVTAFASGKGRMEPREFRVTGEEVITVPAGTFQTYRLAYTGLEGAGTVWIESVAPFRVIKSAPTGIPIEIVRVR